MENETQNKIEENSRVGQSKETYLLPVSIIVSSVILAVVIYSAGSSSGVRIMQEGKAQVSVLEEEVLPTIGVALPVTWGDLGSQLVKAGAVDADKFKAMYEQRGSFTKEYEALLLGQGNGKLTITKDNAGYLLNLFWALGLANKNPILDSGEMNDPKYGGAGNFASTGGWTLAKGDSMNHYSRHEFFALTAEQQALVDKVSRGIYRPCCGNSTHFPDCNHGMAMLGLLELMAS